jgi:hypothetical protein
MIQNCKISSPSSLSPSSDSCSTKNTSPGLIAESFTYRANKPINFGDKEDKQHIINTLDGNDTSSRETGIFPTSPSEAPVEFQRLTTVPQVRENETSTLLYDDTSQMLYFQNDSSISSPSEAKGINRLRGQYSLGSKEIIYGPINVIERKVEIEPLFYAPPNYPETQNLQAPKIHRLSEQNRPLHTRKCCPIHEIFQSPVTLLWKRKFENFNVLQSEVAPILVNSNNTIVLSAPTGSGKTGVFEIAMASHINQDFKAMREKALNWHCKQLPICRKIVYLSPSKALCEERYEDWTSRLSSLKLGIRTAMITGDDSEPGEAFREISQSHLIITTPERWDSLTRRWTENFVLFGSIKLLLIDEVHLLGDPSRGSCIESVICRMKTIFRATQSCKLMESQIISSRSVFTGFS